MGLNFCIVILLLVVTTCFTTGCDRTPDSDDKVNAQDQVVLTASDTEEESPETGPILTNTEAPVDLPAPPSEFTEIPLSVQ